MNVYTYGVVRIQNAIEMFITITTMSWILLKFAVSES